MDRGDLIGYAQYCYFFILRRSRSKYIPSTIKPTDPVLPIKLAASPGFPPMYNPHPTIAKIPPGIKGHHIN